MAVASGCWFGEVLTPGGWLGVLLISGGVLSLAFVATRRSGARSGGNPVAATLWALAGAVVVATYTLIDAAGVRVSGGTERYVIWLFVFIGLPFGLAVLAMKRGAFVRHAVRYWWRGAAGGSRLRRARAASAATAVNAARAPSAGAAPRTLRRANAMHRARAGDCCNPGATPRGTWVQLEVRRRPASRAFRSSESEAQPDAEPSAAGNPPPRRRHRTGTEPTAAAVPDNAI